VKTDLIDLTRQCCDADGYLSLGYRCAQTNFCYDELRPVGDAFWFSLPYRLGLGQDLLFYMQGFLLLLVAYSLFTLFRKNWLPWTLATAALLVQLWPTFFNSLADTPASLLLIEGLLLVLIAAQRQQSGLFFTAGIFLGCSTLLRAAYFNPLCIAGLLFFTFWLWQITINKHRHLYHCILLLSFTLPMALQIYVSWKNMHEWSFLSSDQTHAQYDAHLNSAVVGYDTLLIESSYYWAPSCAPSRGVLTGIKEGNAAGLFCLLSNRVYFYFGSYAPHTFYGHDNKNFISNGFAEEVGNFSTWTLNHMAVKTRNAQSPDGDMKASVLAPQTVSSNNEAYVQSSSLLPLVPGIYRYSIWMWAPAGSEPTSVNIQFFSKILSQQSMDWREQRINQESVELTDRPRQFFFETRLPELGFLVTRLSPSPEFIAWGAMLETAQTSTGYRNSQQLLYSPIGSTPELSGHERLFSKLLLLVNLIVILASFVFLLLLYKNNLSPVYIFVIALLALILAEALLILPEQRFVQALLSMHWILFLWYFHLLTANKNAKSVATHER
jgi:hypothetical protein